MSNNSLQHCCRLTYLRNNLGETVYTTLMDLLGQALPVQLILSFIPDETVHTNYSRLINQMGDFDYILCYGTARRQVAFGEDETVWINWYEERSDVLDEIGYAYGNESRMYRALDESNLIIYYPDATVLDNEVFPPMV